MFKGRDFGDFGDFVPVLSLFEHAVFMPVVGLGCTNKGVMEQTGASCAPPYSFLLLPLAQPIAKKCA